MREFQIGTFTETGAQATDPTAIRKIDIDLSVLVPTTETNEHLEEVRWKSAFRPANLTRS